MFTSIMLALTVSQTPVFVDQVNETPRGSLIAVMVREDGSSFRMYVNKNVREGQTINTSETQDASFSDFVERYAQNTDSDIMETDCSQW